MNKHFGQLFAVLALAGMISQVQAQNLTIVVASEPTSMDPHFHNLGPNNAIAAHIFDRLINQGTSQELLPGLAESWEPIGDTTWEFKLRQGVTFHDGTPFTADDVVFTMGRAGNVPDSPSSFGTYVNSIREVEVIDDHTIHIHTHEVHALLANDLSTVAILSRRHGEGATTSQYNSGEVTIGTGPFTFVEYVPGERIVLQANPDYWGGAPQWERVTFRPITSAPARVAALLSGDVDVIEGVPTADIATLEGNDNVTLSQGVSNRVIYLHLDSDREVTPHATAKEGGEIPNPLRDVRVRKAISHAINRDAIVERIMEGVALPAGQLLPDGFFGVSENIEVPAYDVDLARQLLAEAGYPDGFKLTIHGPSGRYINDAQTLQAVAQMLSRIGIETSVDTMPPAVYFGRASALEFSLMLVGWGSGTGEASSPLRALLATYNPETGMGSTNRGRYSSPEMDALLEQALQTLDADQRADLLARATEVAMNEVGLIPTHFQVNTWGTRKGLRYIPRTDEYTMVMEVVAE